MDKLKVRDVVTTRNDMVIVGENESIENVLKVNSAQLIAISQARLIIENFHETIYSIMKYNY
jgi:hypothetical protein